MKFFAVLGFGFLVALVVGIYYGVIPYLLTLLLNSFGVDVVFWQSAVVWWIMHIIINLFKRGNSKDGN